jgi:hypothetical protein
MLGMRRMRREVDVRAVADNRDKKWRNDESARRGGLQCLSAQRALVNFDG